MAAAADSKSAGYSLPCGFESHLRHHDLFQMRRWPSGWVLDFQSSQAGSTPARRSKNVPNLWPSSLTIRTRAIVQKSIRVRKLIRVYPLTLIRSRKGNWSHGGSTPSTRTNFICPIVQTKTEQVVRRLAKAAYQCHRIRKGLLAAPLLRRQVTGRVCGLEQGRTARTGFA